MKCDHHKLMDTLRRERAKEKMLRFQIRAERQFSDGSPWVARKLASVFCPLLTVILPDLGDRIGVSEKLHPSKQQQEDVR